MNHSILVFNAGSSSIKFSLFQTETFETLFTGEVEHLSPELNSVMPALIENIHQRTKNHPVAAIGHRVVHGGSLYREPILITNKIIEDLRTLIPLAPLHEPHNLNLIEMTLKAYPDVPEVACFDTSFHRTQPRLAELIPIPNSLTDEGVIRYGFHGLSYQYISTQLPLYTKEKAYKRVIVAHLGSGASICALKNLESIATSMGFTALGGLMMGTRTGDLDPGVILYLLQEKGYTAQSLQNMLYDQSGLLGVSGISNDVRTLLNSPSPQAKLALDLFCYIAAKHISSLLPTIAGLDVLVFTAGIGENSPEIRQQICSYLTWLDVELDVGLNTSNANKISSVNSRVEVYRIPTNEELMIAKQTAVFCL